MVLLSSSALLTVSLIRLQRVDLGFDASNVLTFPVSLPGDRYRQDQRASFFHELVSRLQTLPGVVSSGAAGYLPMSGNMSRTTLETVGGRAIPLAQRIGIVYASVTPGYFETVGIKIQRGRSFLNTDQSGSPPVVIINEAEAHLHFGSTDPIGQQVQPGMWNGSGSTVQPRTIVGVARDVKQNLRDRVEPSIYWPIAQIPSEGSMYVTVRTTGDPLTLVSAVRSVLHTIDKDIPLYDVQPLAHYVGSSLARPRDTATLVALFAALALVLTAVGLYGVISYSVARRTREIGVRMALGARPSSLVRAIVGRGLTLSFLGAAIGLPAAIAVARFFRSLLFGVSPQEPLTLVAGAVVLIIVALAASYIPARRAARVDPLAALRYQ
jgi:putative ABC transport system permease protein